jgi:hypothetical protein
MGHEQEWNMFTTNIGDRTIAFKDVSVFMQATAGNNERTSTLHPTPFNRLSMRIEQTKKVNAVLNWVRRRGRKG